MHRMKVTAIIPDQLVERVRKMSGGNNITECIIIAMNEWVAMKRLGSLHAQILKTPLKFKPGFSAQKIRALNRK